MDKRGESEGNMSKYTFEYCDFLGLKKIVEHSQEECDAMDKMPDCKERCQRVCEEYSRKGLWTTYKKDGIEIAHANNADF